MNASAKKQKSTPVKAKKSSAKNSNNKNLIKEAVKSKEGQVPLTVVKPIVEAEKIPFSEVGTDTSVAVPPPVIKPITPVVKVRNRTPLPMPEETAPEDTTKMDNEENAETE